MAGSCILCLQWAMSILYHREEYCAIEAVKRVFSHSLSEGFTMRERTGIM